MPHAHANGGDVTQRAFQALGNHPRTVSAARAADRHREIALALGDVERHDVSDVLAQPIHELHGGRIALHERHDGPIPPGAAPESRDEVGVRQAADVEDQIGVDGNAVLVAEADDGYHKLCSTALARHAHEEL